MSERFFLSESMQPKKDTVLEKFNEKPEGIILIPGSMTEKIDATYKAAAFSDFDHEQKLVTAGKERAIAAALLAKNFPESQIVTLSKPLDPQKPAFAEIYAHEIKKRGVQEERIIQKENSVSTIGGLKDALKTIRDKGWHNVIILSAQYHLPRIIETVNQLANLISEKDEDYAEMNEAINYFKTNVSAKFMSADEILKLEDKHWETYFKKVENTESYQNRVESEKRGVQDLRDGNYRTKE